MSVIVERKDSEIIVRLPDTLGVEFVQALIDRMRFFEVLSRSKATDTDIEELSNMTKRGWSSDAKARLSEMEEFKDLF